MSSKNKPMCKCSPPDNGKSIICEYLCQGEYYGRLACSCKNLIERNNNPSICVEFTDLKNTRIGGLKVEVRDSFEACISRDKDSSISEGLYKCRKGEGHHLGGFYFCSVISKKNDPRKLYIAAFSPTLKP